MKKTIGVMGNLGSFSEEAALHYCQKNKIKDYEFSFLVTAERVLSALSKGEVDLGIFPIENSNGGIVYESVYAMSKNNFAIKEFFEIDVKHNLLVKPGTKVSEINTISSHPQALKQCRMYLKRQWSETELQEYSDTASAAKDLGSGVLPKTTAVIAPRKSAEIYKLDILEEGIQDLKFNFTTFIAATKDED
ncbi:prephenate dehydratase [Candidatus Parcubacteria bacterium]|nr:MAG: prephenate dehydratase [Candidatus Parcubacteria bacterium]